MSFRRPYSYAASGPLMVIAAVGGAWLYLKLLTELLKDGVDGRALLLLGWGPALVVIAVIACLAGVRRVWRAATRYELSSRGLTVRTPAGPRLVEWSQVRDFSLLPAGFPDPPDKLVLVPVRGGPVEVPLSLHPTDEWRAGLMKHFAPLAEHGLDRVRRCRVAPGPPSLLRARWRRHGEHLAIGYGALVFFVLSGMVALAAGREYVNYLRIRADHATAGAEVLEVDDARETTWAKVRFAPPGGGEVRLSRRVAERFADAHKPGDRVTVEYLPHRPRVGRIRGWDMDGRAWVMLLVYAPCAYLCLLAVVWAAASWVLPLRENFPWAVAAPKSLPGFLLWSGGAALPLLSAAFPRWHDGGALIFLRLRLEGEKDPVWDPDAWVKRLTKAGITARAVAESFLVLDSNEARKLLGRLGPADAISARYVVLGGDGGRARDAGPDGAAAVTADEAVRFALLELNAEDVEVQRRAKARCRLFCWWGDGVGLFDRRDLPAVFNGWVGSRLAELYPEGCPPGGAAGADFAALFRIDPAARRYQLLAERGRAGPRLWLRPVDADAAAGDPTSARCAEFVAGRWNLSRSLPAPWTLRASGSRALWLLVALPLAPLLVPLTVIAKAATVLLYPVFAWIDSGRDKRLREAAAAAAPVSPAGEAETESSDSPGSAPPAPDGASTRAHELTA